MPDLTCTKCGTEYSTDRELPRAGASPERCPSCGTPNQPVKADGGGTANGTAAGTPTAGQRPAGETPPGEVAVHIDEALWHAFVAARDPGDTVEDAIQTWLQE